MLERWYCRDYKEILKIINYPSDKSNCSFESLSDCSVEDNASNYSGELSQSDEDSGSVASMDNNHTPLDWTDDDLSMGSDIAPNSKIRKCYRAWPVTKLQIFMAELRLWIIRRNADFASFRIVQALFGGLRLVATA